MDIGKYVGLFLLKNEFCYLPGFGSLQIIKRTATFNKETLKTETPGYEVVFIRGGGAIDDTFANFIANNERISIAHAANHLKDYCAYIKLESKEGNDVLIPGIGKFICKPAIDEIYFETDPELRIQGKQIPYFKISSEVEQKKKENTLSNIIEQTTFREPKSDEEIVIKPAQVNWGKILLVVGVVALILGIVAFIVIQMTKTTTSDDKVIAPVENSAALPEMQATNTIAPATTADTNTAPSVDTNTVANSNGNLKIIINSYPTMERADARMKRLVSYSYSNLEVIEQGTDTLKYHVVLNIQGPVQDVTRTVDSVKKLLNPSGNNGTVKLLP